MLSRIHVGMDLRDCPIGCNEVCHAFGSAVRCRLTSPVRETDFAFCVAQQGIFKCLCFCKFGIGVNAVCAHAQNLHISICIVTDSLLESHAFSRSTTRACSGIKPKYDVFPAIITEFYFLTCMVFDQKIRRDITYCEHYDLLKRI